MQLVLFHEVILLLLSLKMPQAGHNPPRMSTYGPLIGSSTRQQWIGSIGFLMTCEDKKRSSSAPSLLQCATVPLTDCASIHPWPNFVTSPPLHF